MQTKTLTVQDFKTEEQTRKILAQVKKAWREARKNAKLPFADYTRDFIVRINRLMRMGKWELAIDWILDPMIITFLERCSFPELPVVLMNPSCGSLCTPVN